MRTEAIPLAGGESPVRSWEHVNFAPIGINPIPSPEGSPSSLGGVVFSDHNGDLAAQSGEPGIPGVTVTLAGHDADGNAVALTTTTDSNGRYRFTGVSPSDPAGYTITETQPGAYIHEGQVVGSTGGTAGDHTITTVLGGGADSTGNDFVEQPPSQLGGVVYFDLNNDGQRELNEPGLGGVILTLTGTLAGGGTVTATVTTAPDGSYLFGHLWPGTYAIAETAPAGVIDGKVAVGTQVVEPAGTGRIGSIAVAANRSGTGYDFGEDRPPSFTTEAIAGVPVGTTYTYQVGATDPDGDQLHFTLLTGPPGMQLNPSTDLLTWSPSTEDSLTGTSDVGSHAVAIRVEDYRGGTYRGGTAEQDFTLTVTADAPNLPPVFTNTPGVDAYVGQSYSYKATAFDPDFDPLTFSWKTGTEPAGMSDPDPDTSTTDDAAVVTWTPTAAQARPPDHATLEVRDDAGNTATKTFTVTVHPTPRQPYPPLITSSPVGARAGRPALPDPLVVTIPVGQVFTYDVTNVDADNDTRTYLLPPPTRPSG